MEIHKRMVLKLTRCKVLLEIIISLNVCRICGVFMILMSIFPRFDDFDVDICRVWLHQDEKFFPSTVAFHLENVILSAEQCLEFLLIFSII